MQTPVRNDLQGKRFGLLVVMERAENKAGRVRWACICECGKNVVLRADAFRRGIKSCGCPITLPDGTIKRQRAVSDGKIARNHPDYPVWNGMMARCLNPNDTGYQKYGARGVRVCERWMDFWNFIEDMGTRPSRSHSIDRIDNHLGYEAGNCRWATKLEQTLNRTITRYITFEGRTQCLTDWANEVGMSVTGLASRIDGGWPLEKALSVEPKSQKRLIEFNGKIKTVSEWADEIGIGASSLSTRLARWPVERALTEPKDKRFINV